MVSAFKSGLIVSKVFRRYLAPLRKIEWVVYAKPPFTGPEQVLDYVGRYTHRVAISNNRLVDIEDGAVHFRWKDYRHGDRQKVMSVTADEFIRRFLLHVLPQGFRHRYVNLPTDISRTLMLFQADYRPAISRQIVLAVWRNSR